MTLTSRILLAMIAGLLVGIGLNLLESNQLLGVPFAQGVNDYLVLGLFDTVGRIFVASLKLLVVPLVFVSLVCGASGLGDNSRIGAMAGKTLLLYLVTTALAITVALTLGELLQPAYLGGFVKPFEPVEGERGLVIVLNGTLYVGGVTTV